MNTVAVVEVTSMSLNIVLNHAQSVHAFQVGVTSDDAPLVATTAEETTSPTSAIGITMTKPLIPLKMSTHPPSLRPTFHLYPLININIY